MNSWIPADLHYTHCAVSYAFDWCSVTSITTRLIFLKHNFDDAFSYSEIFTSSPIMQQRLDFSASWSSPSKLVLISVSYFIFNYCSFYSTQLISGISRRAYMLLHKFSFTCILSLHLQYACLLRFPKSHV